jgi:hypothetical protein
LTTENKWEPEREKRGWGALETFLTERKDSSKCIVEHRISDYFSQKEKKLLSKKIHKAMKRKNKNQKRQKITSDIMSEGGIWT